MVNMLNIEKPQRFKKRIYRSYDVSGEQLDNNQGTTREQPGNKLDNNQGTTREQPGNKLDNNQGTTREQPGNKLDNNQGTTREQPGNKLDNNQGTTREQPGNKLDNNQGTTREQPGNKLDNNQGTTREQPGNKLDNNQGTTREQPGNKLDNNQGTTREQPGNNQTVLFIESLMGNQLAVLVYITSSLDITKKPYITRAIKSSDMCESIDVSKGALKIHIKRLVAKKIIYRLQGKASRDGYMKFGIETFLLPNIRTVLGNKSPIYNSNNKPITTIINKEDTDQNLTTDKNQSSIIEQLQNQLEIQKKQIEELLKNQIPQKSPPTEKEKLTSHINQQLDSIAPSDATTTLITDDEQAWSNIDISPLESFGFKNGHIKQIMKFNSSLTPEEVQSSIEHYGWALTNCMEDMLKKYDAKFENNKLCLFIGTLKKGNPWIEPAYKSTEELVIEEQLNAKREVAKRRKAQQDELFNLDFEAWYNELSSEKIKMIETNNTFKQLPIDVFNKKMRSPIYMATMKNHYRDKIQPQELK